MNAPTLLDHLFVVLACFVCPYYLWRSYPSFIDSVRTRGEPARIAGYRETIAIWIVFSLVLVALWRWADRAWADLGFRSMEPRTLALGTVVCLVLLYLTHRQMKAFAALEPATLVERRPRLRRALADSPAPEVGLPRPARAESP